jgi:hypothetical protein
MGLTGSQPGLLATKTLIAAFPLLKEPSAAVSNAPVQPPRRLRGGA